MIPTASLIDRVRLYSGLCIASGRRPTYGGLSLILGCSEQTVWNVAHGTYNGKQYTDKPCTKRVIRNDDFPIVQAVFGLVADTVI